MYNLQPDDLIIGGEDNPIPTILKNVVDQTASNIADTTQFFTDKMRATIKGGSAPVMVEAAPQKPYHKINPLFIAAIALTIGAVVFHKRR